jgi:hypothetical protein
VTAGYRQTTEEANETHPLFSPLGVYGLPHIKSRQFFFYYFSILQVILPLKKLFTVVLFTAGIGME